MLKMFEKQPHILADLEAENASLLAKLQKAEAQILVLQNQAKDRFEDQTTDNLAHEIIEETLRTSEARLEIELTDARLLQTISSHLINENSLDTLYQKITDAAQAIMQSDFASMQIYYPETEKLHLLATSGLDQDSKDFWEWVNRNAGTTCAVSLRTGERFMSDDMLNCEHIINTPDHEMFKKAGVLSAQTTPLFSRSGRLLGMISTHWKKHHIPSERDFSLLDILARQGADLIERKNADDAIQQSKSALTEADRLKDEFLATLAHELRNPLSPIKNAVQLLSNKLDHNNAPQLLDMIDRQVIHLVRLIDDLLDVSRISKGKIELRKEKIILQNAISNAIEVSGPLIENGAHILNIDMPEEPIFLNADITRIAQIISNLLNNAAKYTPEGGTISLSVHSEKNEAILSVSDTGVGIPANMLSSVFDLFTQVDRNLDRAQGGLGIGLALVKQLLEMHNGTIEAKSDGLNQGSSFTIRLPIITADSVQFRSTSKEDTSPKFTPAPHQLRVLVVDDNLPAAQTIGWLLELEGHIPTLAQDAVEALKIAREMIPDAMLLDIGLPHTNGYELCKELRKDPLFKDTLIIAQTGWGQQRDRELSAEAGFNHHLVKPLDSKVLLNLLKTEASLKLTARMK